MIIDMVEGRSIKIPRISEVTILRFFEEIVIDGKKNTNYIGKDMLTSSVFRQ
jgi:carbamoyl-phosphate synthase large subunit